MKKLLFILTALAVFTFKAKAEDFSMENADGTKIYYTITDSAELTVGITYRGDYYDLYDAEYKGTVSIPSSVTYHKKHYSVTSIISNAFRGCTGLTSISIPNEITEIEMGAFYGCTGLTNISISEGVTKIGMGAFSGCTGLINITIPNKVTEIALSTFSGCTGLTNITMPYELAKIGSSAFLGCSALTSITIPEEVTVIESSTFSGCSGLTNITIHNKVTKIEPLAFEDCTALRSITIPEGITKIESTSFDGCSSLATLYFNAKKCGDFHYKHSAFNDSPLTTVMIGNKVQRIPAYFLKNKAAITKIIIPEGIVEIGSSAFYGCIGLTSIYIPDGVPEIGQFAFYGCNNLSSSYLQSKLESEETDTETPRYALFPTNNIWTFLKLDTSNGRIWQVQYSTDRNYYRFETYLNTNTLTYNGYNGRFTLLPTQNIYNFLLLDQHNGDVYQVQWNIDDDKRMIIPIE